MMNLGNVYSLESARETREVEDESVFRHEALACQNPECSHEWVIKLTKARKEPKDILCPKCSRYTGRCQ
jgi:hypothetical protein